MGAVLVAIVWLLALVWQKQKHQAEARDAERRSSVPLARVFWPRRHPYARAGGGPPRATLGHP